MIPFPKVSPSVKGDTFLTDTLQYTRINVILNFGQYIFRVIRNNSAKCLQLTFNGLCTTKKYFRDRKSTRLNSSHVAISYAVFCLKKKKNTNTKSIHTY